MRQYELEDCLEDAQVGDSLEVIKKSSPRQCLNCCTLFVGFGNPESLQVSWVPYGSVVEIGGVRYTVDKGKDVGVGRRADKNGRGVPELSERCLRDSADDFHSLYDLVGRTAVVSEVPSDSLSVSSLD